MRVPDQEPGGTRSPRLGGRLEALRRRHVEETVVGFDVDAVGSGPRELQDTGVPRLGAIRAEIEDRCPRALNPPWVVKTRDGSGASASSITMFEPKRAQVDGELGVARSRTEQVARRRHVRERFLHLHVVGRDRDENPGEATGCVGSVTSITVTSESKVETTATPPATSSPLAVPTVSHAPTIDAALGSATEITWSPLSPSAT